jgi:uncharacterized protein YndB with AHSA1/START domain
MDSTAAAHRTELNHELIIDRRFAAPRELVFEVWTQPKHLVNWWGPANFTLPFCEMEFRVGGKYRFCMRSPEGEDHWVSGEYRAIVEPERLEKTWLRSTPAGTVWCDAVLKLTFEAFGDETHFRLHQWGFISAEHRDQHRGGWTQALERLEDYVTVPVA